MNYALDGYGIVNGIDPDGETAQKKLINNMLQHMKEGWIPQGGVSFAVVPSGHGYTCVFSQAIVREKSNDT